MSELENHKAQARALKSTGSDMHAFTRQQAALNRYLAAAMRQTLGRTGPGRRVLRRSEYRS